MILIPTFKTNFITLKLGSQSNPGVSSIPVQLNNFTSAQNNSESQLKYGFASSNQSHPATAGNAALQTT